MGFKKMINIEIVKIAVCAAFGLWLIVRIYILYKCKGRVPPDSAK